MDLAGAAGGRDALDPRAVDRGEDRRDGLEEVLALEGALDRAPAGAHAREPRTDTELEDQGQVGDRELRLALREDSPPVEPARALVGHAGEEVAVGDDGAAGGEGGGEGLAHVHPPVLDEPAQLLLVREDLPGARHLADARARGPAGRLAGREDLAPGLAERVRERGDLGALAAAVEALERDERPALHGRGVNAARHARRPAPGSAREVRDATALSRRAPRAARRHAACSSAGACLRALPPRPSNGTGGRRDTGRRAEGTGPARVFNGVRPAPSSPPGGSSHGSAGPRYDGIRKTISIPITRP